MVDIDPHHACAANNRAVCLLYCCRLADAIAALEDFIRADPAKNTQQAVVSNLATLYQVGPSPGPPTPSLPPPSEPNPSPLSLTHPPHFLLSAR